MNRGNVPNRRSSPYPMPKPIPVLTVGLAFEATAGITFAVLALFGYAVILRSPSYSWPDAILYGAQLTSTAGAHGADQVDFPVHWAHALLRVFGALVIGFLSLVVVAVISGA